MTILAISTNPHEGFFSRIPWILTWQDLQNWLNWVKFSNYCTWPFLWYQQTLMRDFSHTYFFYAYFVLAWYHSIFTLYSKCFTDSVWMQKIIFLIPAWEIGVSRTLKSIYYVNLSYLLILSKEGINAIMSRSVILYSTMQNIWTTIAGGDTGQWPVVQGQHVGCNHSAGH